MTSGRRRLNMRNTSEVHSPMPVTAMSCAFARSVGRLEGDNRSVVVVTSRHDG
jgi:hypothetical protein